MKRTIVFTWVCASVAFGCGGSDETSAEAPPEKTLAFRAKT
jgi:hypothetical protein